MSKQVEDNDKLPKETPQEEEKEKDQEQKAKADEVGCILELNYQTSR